jgi:hypothetical protein
VKERVSPDQTHITINVDAQMSAAKRLATILHLCRALTGAAIAANELLSLSVRFWHKPAIGSRAGHVRSARVFQTSTCSAIARASSTSMPRYLTVLSILVWPSSHAP